MSKISEDADRKVTFLATSLLDTLQSSLTMIEVVSYKMNNKDIGNSNLYLIIFACDKLAEIIDKLPNDDFKKFFETTMKENLSKMSCYIIDTRSEINCNDFYENFLKRKRVNSELLSKAKLKKGGFGGLMFGIAVTALALLQTTTPVLGAIFNSDNFVIQHRAQHSMNLSDEFKEALRKKPIIKTQFNTNTNSLQPSHRLQEEWQEELQEESQEESQEYPIKPLTDLARLSANIHGVCATNAFVAELCTGGCPSKEEWERLSPKILERIRNVYSNKLKSKKDELMLGVKTDNLYGTKFISVDDGLKMEWFRSYFAEGAKKHFSKEKSSSDMAIATVRRPNHALNVMYNMNNQKLCLHDENWKVDWNDEFFWLSSESEEYICEKGFFEDYQITELNKLAKPVFETTNNIFEEYSNRIDRPKDEKIYGIQPQESIFLLDKSKNTGNIDQYIEILKDVRKSIIEGEREGIAFLENNQENSKILEILKEAVQTHEEAYDLENTSFDVQKSRKKIRSLERKLKAERKQLNGGTCKRKKRMSKKRKSKKNR
jgi:hypothetical protein